MKWTLTFILCCISVWSVAQFSEQRLLTSPIIYASQAVTGDFDNDGDADALFASQDEQTDIMVWHQNDGTGTFGQPHVIEHSGKGTSPVAADIDGDGDIDIVCAKPTGWAWFENDGSGNFDGYHFTADPNMIYSAMTVLDVDNDGQQDIIAAGSAIVLYHNSSTAFTREEIGTVSGGITGLFAADIDGDSYVDVLSSDWLAGKIELFTNNGAGGFLPSQIISSTMSGSYCVTAGDLDGDGDKDIVATGSFVDKVSLFSNNGDGTFGTEQVLTTQINDVRYIGIADLDNDGDGDLVATAHLDSQVHAFFNAGNGTFGAPVDAAFAPGSINVALTDLDGDGDTDMLMPYYPRGGYAKNNGDGTFGSITIICPIENTADAAMGVCTADVDNDGDLDVISASALDAKIAWYENTGNGHFLAQQVISQSFLSAQSVYSADLDSDGIPEIYALSGISGISRFERQSDGSWTMEPVISQVASSLAYADIDNDGDLDFVTTTGTQISYYENNGSGTFGTQQILVQLPALAKNVCLADTDNDGDIDLVGASHNQIFYLENQNGTLGSPITISARFQNAYVTYLSAKDIDNDGLTDIAWMSMNYTELSYLRNNGGNTYSEGQDEPFVYGAGNYVQLLLEDYDGDNDLDFILGSSLNFAGIIVLKNDGNDGINTDQYELISANTNYIQCLVMSDLDNDGDKDLVSASMSDDKIAWYENTPLNYTLVSGVVYVDANQNQQQDAGEQGVAGIAVTNSLSSATATSGQNGQYTVAALNAPQDFTVQPQVPAGWVAAPASHTVTIDTAATPQTAQDFGLYITSLQTAGSAQLVGGYPRCNTIVNYWVDIHNTGTTTPSGVIDLELDTALTFIDAAIVPDSINGQHFYWHFDTLGYFAAEQFVVHVQMPDYTQLGYPMTSVVRTILAAPDTLVFSDTLVQVLTCAYDPNDKSVVPAGAGPQGLIALSTETLEYTVRFQNTGNDTAALVVIRDQLDSHLDWSTFELLSGSHPVSASVNQVGLAEFRFENIHLPDSNVNELASHGYVRFRIRLHDNQPVGTVIHNTADIYFDQNPAVITNTTTNTLTECPSPVTYTAPSSLCEGETLTASVNAPDLTEIYRWSFNNSYPVYDLIFHANTMPGTYVLQLTISSTIGCPEYTTQSTVVIHAIDSTQIDTLNICAGESIVIFGNLQTEAGNYFTTLSSVHGCDSIVSVQLEVHSLPLVTLDGFSADTICAGNGAVALPAGIPAGGIYTGTGISGTEFDPSLSGNGLQQIVYGYTTANGCSASDTAQLFVDDCLGLNELFEDVVSLYPNPVGTGHAFTLAFSETPNEDYDVRITTITGETIYQQNKLTDTLLQLSAEGMKNGVFIVYITQNQSKSFTTKRLIVQ